MNLGEFFAGVTTTTVVTALWTFYVHCRGRIFERKLSIDIQTSATRLNEYRLLSVNVTLTNSGGVKLGARQVAQGECMYKWISEDQRFFQHEGFDWKEMDLAVKEAKRKGL